MNLKQKLLAIFSLATILTSLIFQPVLADIAPPEAPPGSTLWPGNESTQVRMLAEAVTLDVSVDSSDPQAARARTTALFTMRNLGSEAEKMEVRFPLRFMMWEDTHYPEINDLRVMVNGRGVSAHRAVLTYHEVRDLWSQDVEIPWSVFEVSFPAAEDVSIEVSYSVHGFGYYPHQAFRYILETGAGWKDSIGSADIIVKLPYDANPYNVWLDAETGFSTTTSKPQLAGDEVRWHFEDFEPTFKDNIEVSLITPSLWQKVLAEKTNITRNPNDGEAWGRLAKAYKEMTREAKGYPRSDPVGLELFQMSTEAYEKCLSLLPRDSLWHTGYADLLWSHYYFLLHMSGTKDSEWMLLQALTHLNSALELDPNNRLARDLLDEVSYSMPEAVVKTASGYDLLALTVTPAPPASFEISTQTPTATSLPTATETATVSPTMPALTSTLPPTPVPSTRQNAPICGGAGLILPLAGAAVWFSRRRTKRG